MEQTRYTAQEAARRGQKRYKNDLRVLVKPRKMSARRS